MAGDAELVLAYLRGDSRAFAAIYDQYGDRIYDFCRSMLRNDADAADAAQDTFVIASQRLAQLREPDRLRAWLYAIARNQALRSANRRARVQPTEDLELMEATGPAVDAHLSAEEVRELVWSAAEGLGERDRAVLELNVRHGLEGQELADAVGVSASHSYVMLFRAREQIERAVGALLVARRGSRDCGELSAILHGWDGKFSPLMRKRVARHVDGCEECSEQRRTLVSPIALYGAVPFLAAPAIVRTNVLGGSPSTTARAQEVRFDGDGFPLKVVGARRGALVTVAAAAVVALVVIAALLTRSNDSNTLRTLAARGPNATSDPAASGGATTSTGGGGATAGTDSNGSTTTGPNGSTTSTSSGSTGSTGTTGSTVTTVTEGSGFGAGERQLDFGSSESELRMYIGNLGSSTITWTGATPDSFFTVSPSSGSLDPNGLQQLAVTLDRNALPEHDVTSMLTVRSSDGGVAYVELDAVGYNPPPTIANETTQHPSLSARYCGTADVPDHTFVYANVSDRTGVAAVSLYWSSPTDGPGSSTMYPDDSGAQYSTTLGPFGGDETVEWWVVATDTASNTSESAHHTISIAQACIS